jgi:acetoin utilization deacetylase AcuC-like enzyme
MSDLNDFLLYHPELAPKLHEFGFDIPIGDDRSKLVFDKLKKTFSNLTEEKITSIVSSSNQDLLLAHHKDFINLLSEPNKGIHEVLRVYGAEKEIDGFDYDRFIESVRQQVGATGFAMEKSLRSGFCFFLGGGMHHASSKQGDGFCLVNDIVIGIRKLQNIGKIKKALIIDIDAHKGDGAPEITFNDDTIFTLSIHMKEGWPYPNETPGCQIPNNIDIEIGSGEEGDYLTKLKEGLDSIKTSDYDLAVVVAGADPYEKDELLSTSLLNLSKEQMLARDIMVYKILEEVPQTWLMAGGYGENSHEIYEQFLMKVLHLR